MRRLVFLCLSLVMVAVAVVALWNTAVAVDQEAAAPEIPGLGDPGKLTSVVVEEPLKVTLRGREARQQLIVTGNYSSGQARDLTHKVTYQATPPGIVTVSPDGFVTPSGNGTATVAVRTPEGMAAKTTIVVEKFDEYIPINFPNQIVPIFSKLGCNSGGCHGKSSGQNGFKLSLLGFYPKEDYEYLVKEARGRRVFPAAPTRSLLLMKATNALAHGGGMRMTTDSYEYTLLKNWIAQGMPFGTAADPTVSRIEVFPKTRTMDRGADQQLAVYAHYSDGSVQDVTRVAQYEPNDVEMAETTATGVVRTLDLTGEAAVMIRFASQVNVFRASVPMGVDVKSFPPPRNFIDENVFAKLRTLGIPPSEVAGDAMFIRRVYLDVTGQLPTADQVVEFLDDKDPAKRDKLIDYLLASPGFADYFASKWSTILRNRRANNNDTRGTYAFYDWIRESFRRDKPYDQFAREIVAASGEISRHPPVAWYRTLNTPTELAEDTAQLFLGLRIQCARCHHHPFEQWSQQDYYGFQAFFARVGRKNGRNGRNVNEEPRIFHNRGSASARNPRTNQNVVPTGLGAAPLELTIDDDPRLALADWMADPKNPFFAPALVNRYWKHFFGRGIVEPEDDMRITNPPSNPELLDALADHFIKSGFSTKALLRTILQSKTYQLSSDPNAYNVIDKQNFSRFYPKRMIAEVLYDSVNQVTNSRANFGGLPPGTRAVQLPDASFTNYFLSVFNKPEGSSPCECERSGDANLAQILHMLMSREVEGKITSGSSRARLLVAEKDMDDAKRVQRLYLWVFSRYPTEDELKFNLAYLARKSDNLQAAYEDMLWALLNSKEFAFIR